MPVARRSGHLPMVLLVPLSIGAILPSAAGQSIIPATQPTPPFPSVPSAGIPTGQVSRGPSQVQWDGSLLTVQSTGDALPQVIREIARETGMKITGEVPDERVYGKYGPASVHTIVGLLFDGLPINMMLVNGSRTKPRELILTTRSGLPTPPQVRQVEADSVQFQQENPAFRNQVQPVFNPPGQGVISPAAPAIGSLEQGNTPQTANGITNGNAQPASPQDGVRTPEQIFEELRRRQQQMQQGSQAK